ncbi:MAG: hypothetical protein JWM35_1513, partial [Verrucomicrobia bacterium]|nr:hypothetical protein [Verrucomicrobiota bacterium]
MTNPTKISPSFLNSCLALLAFVVAGISLSAAEGVPRSFDIPAGPAKEALKVFSEQSGEQLLFSSAALEGVRTNEVKGVMTPREALDQLATNTGLLVRQDTKTGAYSVRKESPAETKNGSSRPAGDRAASGVTSAEDGTLKLDTFEVMDSKLLNMDKARSRDDAQPYVIFDREQIARSGAVSVDDFLKQRLTMNTQGQSPAQFVGSGAGNTSSI